MSLRTFAAASVVLIGAALLPPAAAGLIGTSISADMQPFASAGVITQFTSPQTVVDPGVEFTGQFTPNAGGFPLAVEQVNSFAMSVDISAMALRVSMSEVPGSITGFHNNFGPALRLNVTNIDLPGQYLTGITQIGGPSPFSFSVTSPTSIAIDFDDFSARTMDFGLTTVPEPGAIALLALLGLACVAGSRAPDSSLRRDGFVSTSRVRSVPVPSTTSPISFSITNTHSPPYAASGGLIMAPDSYTDDAICGAMGLGPMDRFAGARFIRLLLKPSFHPEVCITVEPTQLQVVTLQSMLWREPVWRQLPALAEGVQFPGDQFELLKESFQLARSEHEAQGKMIVVDGMPITALLKDDGIFETFDGQPIDAQQKLFVSAVLRLAFGLVSSIALRNRIAACAGYVGEKLKIEPELEKPKITHILVLGQAADRAQFLKTLQEQQTLSAQK